MMKDIKPENVILFDLLDEHRSQVFAQTLAACLLPGIIVAFRGDLGAGKTTIIRAMLRALGIHTPIKSPTYSLVESYDCDHLSLHHFDLYRIEDEHELDYLGFRDYFDKNSVCCIEWPEKAGTALKEVDLSIALTMKGSGRELRMEALTAAGNGILACLKDKE